MLTATITSIDITIAPPTLAEGNLSDREREQRQRVRSAVRNTTSTRLDIRPMAGGPVAADLAVGLLHLMDPCPGVLAFGELSLSGAVRTARGAYAVGRAARAAGIERILCAEVDAPVVAAAAPQVEVVPVATLGEAYEVLTGQRPARATAPAPAGREPLSSVRLPGGSPLRAVADEVAASLRAGQTVLIVGPAGSGRLLAARAAHAMLPELTEEQVHEVNAVYSVAGLHTRTVITRPPLRAPHFTASMAGLIGGGPDARPGEVSLATHGVLLLDELPEFRLEARNAVLRAVTSGEAHVGVNGRRVTLPARCGLVATAMPCPCGQRSGAVCRCAPSAMARYKARLDKLGGAFDRVVSVESQEQPPAVSPA